MTVPNLMHYRVRSEAGASPADGVGESGVDEPVCEIRVNSMSFPGGPGQGVGGPCNVSSQSFSLSHLLVVNLCVNFNSQYYNLLKFLRLYKAINDTYKTAHIFLTTNNYRGRSYSFAIVLNNSLSPGHDVKLHPHRVMSRA